MSNNPGGTIPNLETLVGSLNPKFNSKRTPNYPHKIFSLAEYNLPGKVNDLFDLCAYFFHTSSLIHPVVYKMSEYPITHFKYTTGDKRDQERTKNLIENYWRGRHHLIQTGLYYHTFGNCFTMVIGVCKRYLRCPKCSVHYQLTNFSYKWKDFKPWGECLSPKCKYEGEFEFLKTYPRMEQYVRLVTLDPRDVDIRFNPVTNTRNYLYKVPQEIQNRIRRGDPYILQDIPDVFLDAVKKRRMVQIDPQCLFHFHRPGLTPSNEGYGMPLIAPVMQDVYYQKTLRRAQEAISLQHIVPLMVLFPQHHGNISPGIQHNMADWRRNVESEFTKWKKDPNHVPIMPIPLGIESVGGDARSLLITPELEQVNAMIINGMLAPREIVEGGLSWSGSSISLRMVENHFVNYRNDVQEFLKFASEKAFSYLGWNNVNVELQPFRMADDIQRLQLLMGGADRGVISVGRYLDELDIDADEDHKRRMEEMENSKQYSIAQAQQQAEAEGEAGIVAARYAVKQQRANTEEQADAAGEEAGLPIQDPQGFAAFIAEMVVNAPGEMQQAAMQYLQEMPTLSSMVQEHIMAIYEQEGEGGEGEGNPMMTDEEPTGEEEGGVYGGGPADGYGGGPAYGPTGPYENRGMEPAGGVEAPMPEQLPPRRPGGI